MPFFTFVSACVCLVCCVDTIDGWAPTQMRIENEYINNKYFVVYYNAAPVYLIRFLFSIVSLITCLCVQCPPLIRICYVHRTHSFPFHSIHFSLFYYLSVLSRWTSNNENENEDDNDHRDFIYLYKIFLRFRHMYESNKNDKY